MVSQAIAIIVLAGLSALTVAMVQKLNSETNVSDAQVRLRQATHLMLRDTQGIGGDVAAAGDLLVVTDGGAGGSDRFTLFKRDESICGGGISATGNSGVNALIEDITLANGTLDCPLGVAGVCPVGEIEGRQAIVLGRGRAVELTTHNASPGPCHVNFPPGQQRPNVVADYNARFGRSVSNMNGLLGEVLGGGDGQILFGTTFTYQLNGTTLERSVDGGQTFVRVLDNVFDLQVERIFAVDGVPKPAVTASSGTALPAGISAEDFLGLRIGIITFARAADGMEVPPPSSFSNHVISNPPTKRRYRSSFIFSAARNRGGA